MKNNQYLKNMIHELEGYKRYWVMDTTMSFDDVEITIRADVGLKVRNFVDIIWDDNMGNYVSVEYNDSRIDWYLRTGHVHTRKVLALKRSERLLLFNYFEQLVKMAYEFVQDSIDYLMRSESMINWVYPEIGYNMDVFFLNEDERSEASRMIKSKFAKIVIRNPKGHLYDLDDPPVVLENYISGDLVYDFFEGKDMSKQYRSCFLWYV